MRWFLHICYAALPLLLAIVYPFFGVLRGYSGRRMFFLCWLSLALSYAIFSTVVPSLGYRFYPPIVEHSPAPMLFVGMFFFGWIYAGLTVLIAGFVRWLFLSPAERAGQSRAARVRPKFPTSGGGMKNSNEPAVKPPYKFAGTLFVVLLLCFCMIDFVYFGTMGRMKARDLALRVEVYRTIHGAYPTEWRQLDGFGADSSKPQYVSQDLAKQFALLKEPVPLSVPGEGQIIALWRNPGVGTTATLWDGSDNALNLWGRYVLCEKPRGTHKAIFAQWLDEADIQRMFAAAGQPLPVPSKEIENPVLSVILRNLFPALACCVIPLLPLIFLRGRKTWQKRQKANA